MSRIRFLIYSVLFLFCLCWLQHAHSNYFDVMNNERSSCINLARYHINQGTSNGDYMNELDFWGLPYVISVRDDSVTVFSSGPDGNMRTIDDILYKIDREQY